VTLNSATVSYRIVFVSYRMSTDWPINTSSLFFTSIGFALFMDLVIRCYRLFCRQKQLLQHRCFASLLCAYDLKFWPFNPTPDRTPILYHMNSDFITDAGGRPLTHAQTNM